MHLLKSLLAALLSPHAAAVVSSLAGVGLTISGVYILAGTGWAFLAGAVPLLVLSGVLIRGLIHGG